VGRKKERQTKASNCEKWVEMKHCITHSRLNSPSVTTMFRATVLFYAKEKQHIIAGPLRRGGTEGTSYSGPGLGWSGVKGLGNRY